MHGHANHSNQVRLAVDEILTSSFECHFLFDTQSQRVREEAQLVRKNVECCVRPCQPHTHTRKAHQLSLNANS